MSRRSDNRRDPLGKLIGTRGFPFNTGPLPHHPCIRCGKGDATRVVIAGGDPQYLAEVIIILADLTELEDADLLVTEGWDHLHEYQPGRRQMPVRMCRGCAVKAGDHFDSPLPIYSAAKLERGEYAGQQVRGIVQS